MNNRLARKFNNNGYQGDLKNIGWIKILEMLPNIDLSSRASLSTCCYLPVKKAMLRDIRKQKREGAHEEIPLDLSDSQNLELQIIAQEQKELLYECLEKLPEQEKIVLQLHFGFCNGEEWTFQEIGKVFNLSKQRVKQIEDRAIERLRQLFYDQEHKKCHFVHKLWTEPKRKLVKSFSVIHSTHKEKVKKKKTYVL
ncbi:RNA polymerase sigma factor [Candidatus Vecturithrix granuli]|uniref:RNA polymerase sigma factor n=1 Tax=Vecturithrix granuli TaxID=1499967 RepID=A0A081CA91_VECG1|nr:RNA polymerase sigma factor [Candidatus Vecturithrix granuli]